MAHLAAFDVIPPELTGAMTTLTSSPSHIRPADRTADLTIDQRIGRFARDHDGLISEAAAARLDISTKALRYRRDRGILDVAQPHVYRVAGAPTTMRQQLRAAVWAHDGLTVVSHRSATTAHGIDLPCDPVVEVAINRPFTPDLEGVVVHRSSDLAAHHLTELDGLPITTMARTIIDLGAVQPWWIVERVLETAVSRRLVTIAEVQALREELSKRGRAGVGIVGGILERRGLGDADSHSVLEAMFANIWRDHEIEGLVYQHHVVVAGRDRYIDFAVPHLKVAFELKGYEHHSRWATFVDDCVRGAELTLLGWTVIEFTWDDVVHRPGYVARVVREAIRLASAAPSGPADA